MPWRPYIHESKYLHQYFAVIFLLRNIVLSIYLERKNQGGLVIEARRVPNFFLKRLYRVESTPKGWLHGKISARRTGLKKAPIIWNSSARTETEIGSEPRLEFVGSLCCFGNLHLPTSINPVFSPGWKFFMRITWDVSARVAQTGLKFQTGLKLFSCNRELRFSSILSEGRAEISAQLTGLELQPLKFSM